jgi:hypothetical protein
MSDNNRRQARIPEGAIPLENPVGTAPCFIVEDHRGVVISLPGVPSEMRYMIEHSVLPYLREKFDLRQVIKSRTLRTCGIGESTLDSHIADLEESVNPTVGLSAHPGQSDIRITAKAENLAEADAMLDAMEARVRERVGDVIFGVDNDRLASVLADLLRQRSLTIAIAEHSISGLLSSWLSDADPEGDTFAGGWVLPVHPPWAYAPDHICPDDARQEAIHLADRVCEVTGAQLGLGVVNRGPDQTYTVLAYNGQVRERTIRFRGHDRHAHIWIATLALDLVRRTVLGLPEPGTH